MHLLQIIKGFAHTRIRALGLVLISGVRQEMIQVAYAINLE